LLTMARDLFDEVAKDKGSACDSGLMRRDDEELNMVVAIAGDWDGMTEREAKKEQQRRSFARVKIKRRRKVFSQPIEGKKAMPSSSLCCLLLLLLISIPGLASCLADHKDDKSMRKLELLLTERSKNREWKQDERFSINAAATLAETSTSLSLPLEVEEEEEDPPTPTPPVWPEVFHASIVQFRNGTSSLVDLYYDWRRGRNANLIRKQLDGPQEVLFDLEYQNRTSFYFTKSNPERGCKKVDFPVGILTPDWLAGARYLGRKNINGFECRGWAKGQGKPETEDFVHYWARASDDLPVRWTFHVGEPMEMNVYGFVVGEEMAEEEWQAPGWCF
jgi:hypothetical protein